ncbi:glycosyl hydrolase 115 family protein [Aquibacillus koreensis]|uniref:Glycosyl hydrolase 115 family protein n=1 Tax=Aquibacillus koreensis TaxID=279446 RepID=A0A9X3WKF9_9BACI|nr:glycosyl hydrolase 115 family protein [Aquibacillus koreensis]MCT2537493.1 glycosyl hydrolase 115 family protein [Aquibacillus koreensis]MDC3418939.1 glycosyl hydrolase 115 family protein [Aquibacillus koreensis]
MEFIINQEILGQGSLFYQEEDAFSGVNKIAKKVMHDVELVFGDAPQATMDRTKLGKTAVLYGTVGHSPMLQELEEKKLVDLSEVTGKREVFLFKVVDRPFEGVEKALVIAGSDKRGTIYGLFHLSELMGVSPLVDWADVKPKRKASLSLSGDLTYVSKEPSVRYRGFFINDEWPAFGNWTMKRFGGFNAEMYEHIFELLLRMKGNYMWPAMWSARFFDEGPGLANAELADEYGVVMGASHHEPALRYGEEYKYLRGKDSKYGDAWNFVSNREGITKFWEDGLKRGGKFENVITVGMRGEQDTSIMGKESTLADNIEYLRDVIQTQNKLIEENVNPNLSEVPRMLALYKEVEPFFYGDENTPGLMNSEELEDVILMLCDDNHGNLRTLPTEEMRSHSGGYGMYYHFDYHGGPVSYEWINSSYLPKVWEQMTMAYDFGVRDLWIVNVGDVATQEFPLSYFMDLAYDFDKWGTNAINSTELYTRQWMERQFDGVFTEEDKEKVFELLTGYTKIAHKRRPEAMHANVYHPVNYKETDHTLEQIDYLLNIAEELYEKVDKEDFSTYFSLVYYPAVGNLNLQKMWLLTTKNHYDAKLRKMEANKLSEQIKGCFKKDRELVEQFHTIDDGKWFGMGLSEHIGFIHWNEEEAQYPILMNVLPANKPRMVVTIDGTERFCEGPEWHDNKLYLNDFLQPDIEEASFTISSVSDLDAEYEITCETKWLTCSKTSGSLDGKEKTKEDIDVKIDRSAMNGETEGRIVVKMSIGTCEIIVNATNEDFSEYPKMTFVDTNGYISIEAEHFSQRKDTTNQQGDINRFKVLEGYGKTRSAVKAFPTTSYYTAGDDAPYLEYQFVVQEAGNYELEFYMQPSNPVAKDNTIYCGIQVNTDDINIENVLPEGYRVGGDDWAEGVLDNIHKHVSKINCKEGLNTLRIHAVSPGFVLEKLVIYPDGKKPANSYLGPTETYFVGK